MTDADIVRQLREASRQKKMEYVVHSVKAKLMRKTLKETLLRGKPLSEAYEGGLGPSMDMGPSSPPSERGPTSGAYVVKSASYKDYPNPELVEDELAAALNSKRGIEGTEKGIVFLMGSGPGTYRQLMADFKEAQKLAAAAKDSAMTADEMIAAFQNIYTRFSPEDQKKVRGAARKYLLGMKSGFGGGIK